MSGAYVARRPLKLGQHPIIAAGGGGSTEVPIPRMRRADPALLVRGAAASQSLSFYANVQQSEPVVNPNQRLPWKRRAPEADPIR